MPITKVWSLPPNWLIGGWEIGVDGQPGFPTSWTETGSLFIALGWLLGLWNGRHQPFPISESCERNW